MTLDAAAKRLAEISGKPVRSYATRDFGRDRNPAAVSTLVAEDKAAKLVDQLRADLGPGLVAFVGCTRSLDDPPAEGSEVVVAPGRSQFDILRVAKSDAVNFDMDTEDLIRKLEEWDRAFGIDIFHAETDTIEFRFRTKPKDMHQFCQDLYKFCPDIVDQGIGTVEALEKSFQETDVVFLWWD